MTCVICSPSPFELLRLDIELKVCLLTRVKSKSSALRGDQLAGEYGFRNKRELWCISLVLSRIRRAGCELLKLKAENSKCLLEGKLRLHSST
ncbi:unnamed protein product [Rhizoctonia solani]|uniref:Uncharacterized protein n=1 Tax=Rhizoctonia solani TaxID=456999 RepID=A0A8H2XZJ4_9AGAM|nr:unnamed protein product [Rhizoctonia solani]